MCNGNQGRNCDCTPWMENYAEQGDRSLGAGFFLFIVGLTFTLIMLFLIGLTLGVFA